MREPGRAGQRQLKNGGFKMQETSKRRESLASRMFTALLAIWTVAAIVAIYVDLLDAR